MGRKTLASIGRPLPEQTTMVVTRDPDLKIEGCLIAHSLPEAIETCAGDREVFIGGAGNTLYITGIQLDVAGDVFFPEFDRDAWFETSLEALNAERPTKSSTFLRFRYSIIYQANGFLMVIV